MAGQDFYNRLGKYEGSEVAISAWRYGVLVMSWFGKTKRPIVENVAVSAQMYLEQ